MFAPPQQSDRMPAGPAAGARRAALAMAPFVLAAAFALSGPSPRLAGAAVVLAAAGWCAVTALILAGLRTDHPHARFGAANVVTLARAGAVLALGTALLHGADAALGGWPPVAGIAALLALDGVDGALARRANRTSPFGARFDMEVDSAFALTLALLAWRVEGLGAWVVALGLPRYLFLGAAALDPDLKGDLPPSFARKAVCVQQIATLCALFVPGLPGSAAATLVAASLGTLGWSFGRDILRLKRVVR